jgi:outer membrane protein assembly factor BamB
MSYSAGDIIWMRQLGTGVNATPALSSSVLYVPTVNGSVFALSAFDGGTRWTYSVAGTSIISAPALDADYKRLYVATVSGLVVALRALTGSVVFAYDAGSQVSGPLTLTNDGLLYFTTFDDTGVVTALDTRSGDVFWTSATGDDASSYGAVLVDGTHVFAVSASGVVLALEHQNTFSVWSYSMFESVQASPVIHNNRVFVVTLGGTVAAFDKQSGEHDTGV